MAILTTNSFQSVGHLQCNFDINLLTAAPLAAEHNWAKFDLILDAGNSSRLMWKRNSLHDCFQLF